jgi:hypothetical protein
MYASRGADQGRGERTNPTDGIPQWTPGPGSYVDNCAQQTDGNLLKLGGFGFGTGVRQERKDVTKGPGVGHYHKDLIEAPKSTKADMSKNVRFKRGANEVASAAWPSPAAYKIPEIKGPSYSLGSRFEEKRTPMYRKADGSRFDS